MSRPASALFDVCILGAARTPLGSFQGALSSVTGPALGSTAIRGALAKSGVSAEQVDEVYMGNVISAGQGQAPARQASVGAGIDHSVPCTTINKVCSSGLKSGFFGAFSIAAGINKCVVTGGFESMSNIPYYLPKARTGMRLGHGEVQDGIIKDGLWDAFDDHHMGVCAEVCASEYGFSRKDQDDYAIESYRRAAAAWDAGYFASEVVPVEIKSRKGTTVVSQDEEYKNLKMDKVPDLRPVFKKDGTVTAANASSINDGAAAMVLADYEWAVQQGLKPLARIRAVGDAGLKPVQFTTAPAPALESALKTAGLSTQDLDLFELNEAFSVVSLANMKLLGLDAEKVNVFGGAVSLGHPIGCSGARIVVTLLNALEKKDGTLGAAAICNGGGEACAMVVERLR